MNFDFKMEPGQEIKRELYLELDHKSPLVSIITPFYNAGKYFEQTFKCVVNQTFPWFEWIIVDDGSTNQSDLSLLDDIAKRDIRINVYHKRNGGISTARNYAVKESRTEFIIPLDADDLIAPTYIECLYWGLFYNKDCDWVYTKNIGFGNQEYIWDKQFDANLLKTYNFLTYSGMIRKSAILEVGGYNEITKHYFEDWYLWLKLLSAGKKPLKLGFYGFWYRRLDTGVLSIVTNDPQIKKIADELISDAGQNVDISISAKEYPRINEKEAFRKISRITWNRVLPKNNKKNILMIIPWMEMGGADLFNLNFIKLIDKQRFSVCIVTTVPSESTWRQKFEEFTDEIFELPTFLDNTNYISFIDYYIKSRNINIVFNTNSYYGYYIIPWIRMNYPSIKIIDYVHMEEWYWRNGGYARISGVFDNYIDKTFVCNNNTRETMIKYFNKDIAKIETLYIGVDTDKYNEENVQKGLIRNKFDIDCDTRIILFPCRIHLQKRPYLMLAIAEKLYKDNFAFVIVGDGPLLSEMQEYVKLNNLDEYIYFAGRQENMLPFYKDSDLTLICSLKEGLALTAYESLAMGTPVVSSDVGGQAELIDNEVGRIIPVYTNENDINNKVFQEEEVNQYIFAIKDILSDQTKYTQMCSNAKNKVRNNFSLYTMIEKLQYELETIYEKNEEDRSKNTWFLSDNKFMVEELPILYNEFDNIHCEAEIVWIEKERIKQLYDKVVENYQNELRRIEECKNEANDELRKIYSMRSWKIIKKYQFFMNSTIIGKILSKIKCIIFK
ncbi:glycosyltransferase [Diplocloster hominis]|uniref:glycosyltransferase n=1 Tax=Diplocloster hominis TaxID=3079010 RepID=UPI0031B9E958